MFCRYSELSPQESLRMMEDLEDADETEDTEFIESRLSSDPSSTATAIPENASLECLPLSLASTLRVSCITKPLLSFLSLVCTFASRLNDIILTVELQVSFPPLFLGQPNHKPNLRTCPTPPNPYILTTNKVVIVLNSVAFIYLANRYGQEEIPAVQVFLELSAICSSHISISQIVF
jgi:hypothetical protein